jgi:hypothetical protein
MKQEEDGVKRYFWDSYAVIEFISGNPNYARFINEPVRITVFNLVEIYWMCINEYGEKIAREIYEKYKLCVVKVSDEILMEAIRFRKKVYKDKKISYADAIGYIYSINNNMFFLTGDKEFKDLKKVEFVQ